MVKINQNISEIIVNENQLSSLGIWHESSDLITKYHGIYALGVKKIPFSW